MASLIWEPHGAISSTQNLKFRVKMSDGENMADSDEGVDFINIINTQDFSKIDLGDYNTFRYSLGLGYIDYNYDEFWLAAEEYYAQDWITFNPHRFASLGGGVGMASGYGVSQMPFSSTFSDGSQKANMTISAMYWEVTNYSCIIELEPFTTYVFEWGNEIQIPSAVPSTLMNQLGLTLNADAPFTAGGPDSVPKEYIDSYNILVGFILRINGESGVKNIFPVDRSTVDSAISDGRIIAYNGFTPFPFAPVVFNAEGVYDFTVSILNFDTPEFVSEAQSDPLVMQLKSQDYNGQIKIYLVDSESVAEVNEAIADDLSEWYGEISEDVVASYGTLDYNNQKIITDSICGCQTNQYQITYTANNVNAGQTDTMSVFIKLDSPDFESYGDDQSDAEVQWNLMPSVSRFSYADNIEINILDTMEEHIEIYNPSDNLITQPADIMHHIFGEELGFDKNNIDLFSKTESRSQHEDFEMAFSINKEIESKKLIQEISQSCKSFPVIASDNLKFITIKNTYTGNEKISTIKADDVFDYSFSRTSVDDIITKVEVKYNKDYGLDTYLDSHIIEAQKPTYFYNGDMFDDFREDNYYGVKEGIITGDINHVDSFLDFESPYIRDPDSAYALAEYLFYWNVNQHNIVELKLPLSYYAFEIGDLIEFDKMMLGKKVYGEKYVLGDSDKMPVRAGQYILPLFMITETKKDLDSIKIKAIQLHHMSGNQLTYKGKTYVPLTLIKQEGQESGQQIVAGSGDFNGDGFTDILDVVFMINKIVDVESFTDEETLIADVNGDGQVNVLDVIIIVNRITNG